MTDESPNEMPTVAAPGGIVGAIDGIGEFASEESPDAGPLTSLTPDISPNELPVVAETGDVVGAVDGCGVGATGYSVWIGVGGTASSSS